jgi:hypothetical protein
LQNGKNTAYGERRLCRISSAPLVRLAGFVHDIPEVKTLYFVLALQQARASGPARKPARLTTTPQACPAFATTAPKPLS